ncbi:MAG TPA: cellulose synthase family protein [Anaerolineales bacterium]|nr:cellulose synthase family protein [Anaerolineales bacterium]
MQVLAYCIEFFYLCVILGLALYGLNSLYTTMLFLFTKRVSGRKALTSPENWPPVTVQLPIYNEKYMVERLLRSITNLDYPTNQLQIQVLDDSSDDTVELVGQLVRQYRDRGINIEHIRRTDRKGYKAGALDHGLKSATGQLIGIFDADFVPHRDWLKRTVPLFQDKKLGCLQTRWGHTNRKYNSLTQAEAMAIDGHFVVEQTVRSRNDFFLNFNGTAGLWRRACIEDAGGWQWDTLTEDLDLSYRAQLRNWKIEYLPDVVVPAELPAQVEAFKKQQFRWAKGSFQVVRKILPRVFEHSRLSLRVRFLALLHLTGYFVHPLMVALLLLTLPVGLLVPEVFKMFPLSIVAGFGPPLLYAVTSAPRVPPLGERLKLIPLMTIMGFGISLSTSIAVLEGLMGKGGSFIRTPKLNLSNSHKQTRLIDQSYREPISPLIWVEIALGLYALATILVLTPSIGWGIAPWMLVYAIGYFYIAGLNLIQNSPKEVGSMAESTAG